MSHLHIEQLSAVFEEYAEVREAVAQRLRDSSYVNYGILQRAERNLETTYVIRLFSEFEGILRLVLLTYDPRERVSREAHNRINRAARLFSIPDQIRDNVHHARLYRNSVVHPGGVRTASLTFGQARSALNRFLKLLP
jgi:hypothetical protein